MFARMILKFCGKLINVCHIEIYDAGRLRGDGQYWAELRRKLRGRAAQQMAWVDSLSKYPFRGGHSIFPSLKV